MAWYTYHLNSKGLDAWERNRVFENGQTWRGIQMDLASRPARAKGCEGVKLVAPDGTVLAESDSLVHAPLAEHAV